MSLAEWTSEPHTLGSVGATVAVRMPTAVSTPSPERWGAEWSLRRGPPAGPLLSGLPGTVGRGGRRRPWLFSPCGLRAAAHTQRLGRGGGGELPGQGGTPGLPGPPHPLCSGWAGAGGWCRGQQAWAALPLGDKLWGTVGSRGSRPCDPSKRSPLGACFPALKGGPALTPSASCGPVPSCRQGQVRTLRQTTRSGRPTPPPPGPLGRRAGGHPGLLGELGRGCCFPSPPLKPALGGCTSVPRHPWLQVPLVQGHLVTIPFSGHTLLPAPPGVPRPQPFRPEGHH